ncbi:porin [Photobacterium frigidiphilum]|uniref:Porin n=1 Tax=Photobacterium frigidiphilum TaxID=264736 RepID=A0A2T3JRC2_9GAMM|nr:porin [Photobacterium frigidiphilum]PSU51605.1 porin [Photobacterium frigidiphilum]
MKKTLVALAILTAAGSANAGINLYDADGVKVDLSGAAEVQYHQGFAKSVDKTDTNAKGLTEADGEIRLDDGDIAFNTTVAVSDNMNAVAALAFEMESGKVTNDELWVGISGDFGTMTFGRQYLIADDSGIGKDIELGGEAIDFVVADGDQTVKYVFDNGQFYAGVSALLNSDGKDQTSDEGQVIDGRLGARFGDLDARVYLYSSEDMSGANSSRDGFNLEAEYNINAFSLAASYGQIEDETSAKAKTDIDVIMLAGSYTMNKTTFAGGYNNYSVDTSGTDDINTFYANVTQQLHSNVKVYGEVGYTDLEYTDVLTNKKVDDGFGYVVGMEVTF